MNENDDENEESGDERGEGVIEAIAELRPAAGHEVAKQIDRHEPHDQEEEEHEDDLHFTHAGVEAAGSNRRDEEEAGFGEVTNIAVIAGGELGTSLVDSFLELEIDVFVEEADEEDIGKGHDDDKGEEGFPAFEDELEGRHRVREEAGGVRLADVIFAVGAAEATVRVRLRAAESLVLAAEVAEVGADSIEDILPLSEGRGLGSFRFYWFCGGFIGRRRTRGLCGTPPRGDGLSFSLGFIRNCFCHAQAFRYVFR